MFKELYESIVNEAWDTENPPETIVKAETMDDVLNHYPKFGGGNIVDRVPKQFLDLYNKYKDKNSLNLIATAILNDLGVKFTEQNHSNVEGWVYYLKDDERKDVRQREDKISNELKTEIISNYVGKRLEITMSSEGDLLGRSEKGGIIYRVVKNNAGDVFLMAPHSKNRGYKLDNPDLRIVKIQGV
jgi:hypothetical protein